METIKKEKEFDCVKMKNDIQAKIYAETKDMNVTELLAYYNKGLQNDSFWHRIKMREAAML
jgi:protein-disulfide isomerase-like protein with CxxC motif